MPCPLQLLGLRLPHTPNTDPRRDGDNHVATGDSWSPDGNLYFTLFSPTPQRKRIRGERSKGSMRYDTNIIRFIFKTSTPGVIYPDKCDPLLSSHCGTLSVIQQWIVPLLHTALGFSFCSGIQSPVLKHTRKMVTILQTLLGLDQLWYLVSSALASSLSIRLGLKWLLASFRNKVPAKGWRSVPAIMPTLCREPGGPVCDASSSGPFGLWSAQRYVLPFLDSKYKEHYLASHTTTIKICHAFRWQSVENLVWDFSPPVFLDSGWPARGRRNGRPRCVSPSGADFSSCLSLAISLLFQMRKEVLTGC